MRTTRSTRMILTTCTGKSLHDGAGLIPSLAELRQGPKSQSIKAPVSDPARTRISVTTSMQPIAATKLVDQVPRHFLDRATILGTSKQQPALPAAHGNNAELLHCR